MKLKILGSTASIPDVNNDCPCFLINEKYLFDCGFDVLSDLRETGCDLSKIRYICFTHMHHDHYLGLPALLFYFIHSHALDLDKLTVIGPRDNLREVLDYTYKFLQLKKYYPDICLPQVKELDGGETFTLEEMTFATKKGNHSVPAVKYKLTEDNTGKSVAIAGDTRYTPDDNLFFKGCNVLLHDSTLSIADDKIKLERPSGHSTIYEAVLAAENSEIGTLFPMHMSVKRAEDASKTAQSGTTVEIIPPERGKEYEI